MLYCRRSLIVSGGLAYALPGVHHRSILSESLRDEDVGRSAAILLCTPGQAAQDLCDGAEKLLAAPLDHRPIITSSTSSHCQESLLFSVRHGLQARGWTRVESASYAAESLWVRGLDLSQARNQLEGFKLEVHLGECSPSADASVTCSLSVEPVKVTTRGWEPGRRGDDGEVFVLPDLAAAIVHDDECNRTENMSIDEHSRSVWSQAHNLDLPKTGVLRRTAIVLRGSGNAEDGGMEWAMTEGADQACHDLSSNPLARLEFPVSLLLREEPDVKKMTRANAETMFEELKQVFVDIGFPSSLAEVHKGKFGGTNPWKRGGALAKSSPPLWSNGNGMPLIVPVPFPAEAGKHEKFEELDEYERSLLRESSTSGSEPPACQPQHKWIAQKVQVSMASVIAALRSAAASFPSIPASAPFMPGLTAADSVKGATVKGGVGNKKANKNKTAATVDEVPAGAPTDLAEAPAVVQESKKGKSKKTAKKRKFEPETAVPMVILDEGLEKSATNSVPTATAESSHRVKTKSVPFATLNTNAARPSKNAKKAKKTVPFTLFKRYCSCIASSTAPQTIIICRSYQVPSTEGSKKTGFVKADVIIPEPAADVEQCKTTKASKIPPLADLRKLKVAELKEIAVSAGIVPLVGKASLLMQLASIS